jgi:hypothetical protein
LLTIRPLAAALNKHRHRLSASPCRADGAKGAARHISVTPYPARKDTRASGPLAPLELPGEEMPGCLGARTLGYYHCNKEAGQPVGRHSLRGDCLALRSFFFLPEPGAASLCSDAPGRGLYMRVVAALQSPGSRRSVAPHRLCAPLPPLYSPALPRGCNRPRCHASRRTVGRFTPAPVRPAGAPSTPPGRAWRPLRGDRRYPPSEVTFVLPGPGRRRFAPTAGPRAFTRTAPRPQKPADAPPIRSNMNLSSGPRQTHASL